MFVLCGALRRSHVTILPLQLNGRKGCHSTALPSSLQPRQATALSSELPRRNTILRGHSIPPTTQQSPAFASCNRFAHTTPNTLPTTPPRAHTMSPSPLDNFNPNGNYPFMNHTKSALPTPPPPSKYPQGVPSASHVHSQKPPSPPGSQPPSPLTAPMPQYPPPQMVASSSTSSPGSNSGYIFTLYRPDGCRTPELPDILSTKKKPTWNQK